ncbi:hypothetical protein PCORN_14124 [Listeria cornellensis FSL F6-0969]|uniref:Uncharacterized protein n=1 Tax=Listeria cornellensis FSL F6-0969 TaxID=1265820 RepID=W7BP79_9LIST|nr:hypothetical protein PCORN_14124 [Listeria cornellensis FSL F6-0969]
MLSSRSIRFFFGGEMTTQGLIVTIFVFIWGMRLFLHLANRNIGKPEDYRYVNMRKRWGTHFAKLKAYLNVFILQGVLLYIISLPILLVNTTSADALVWWNYAGIAVWIIGFFFEVAGDEQLRRFKKKSRKQRQTHHDGTLEIYASSKLFWRGA